MPATFVRDWRPETRQAIEQAFNNPNWEHPKAVNALARMPLELDPMIVDLVARFAIKINEAKGKLTRKRIQGTIAIGSAGSIAGPTFTICSRPT